MNLKDVVKYLPQVLMVIKFGWSMYRAKIRAEGMKDALKHARDAKVEAERELVLARRSNESREAKRSRHADAVREFAARQRDDT